MLLTDVIFIDVGVDERDLGTVFCILHRRLDDLVHGGDTRSTSDHQKMRSEVSSVVKIGPGVIRLGVLTCRQTSPWDP